jgi:hypothetical protein
MTRLAWTLAAVLFVAPPTRAAEAIGSMTIPVTVADLAAAIGVHREDPSTLPLDIVRMAFASPADGHEPEASVRAALNRVLAHDGQRDRLPLPLSASVWREHVLDGSVTDDRLAAAIFGSRGAALLYHGLMGVDADTLAWMGQNPAILRVLSTHPGTSAAFARSIRIRDGAVQTPGESSQELWAALVGADPRQPASFITSLMESKNGRVASFYDAVMHLDAPHQRFALGPAGALQRIDRARRLLDAVVRQPMGWRIEDLPFLRADVDAALLLRVVAVDGGGNPAPPAASRLWARAFGVGEAAAGTIDAAWLAAAVLGSDSSTARRRLDMLGFAQRALADPPSETAAQTAALRGYGRYPLLMLVLEDNGVRGAATFAAAARAADALAADTDAIAVFQAVVGIVDRARRAGTLHADQAQALLASLFEATTSGSTRQTLVAWTTNDLLGALRRAVRADATADADAVVIAAMAGPRDTRAELIGWEDQRYRVDLSPPESDRLKRIRRLQDLPLGPAIAAATPRNIGRLADALGAIIYAAALGDPAGAAATAGPVWQRHRLNASGPTDAGTSVAWRLATETFGGGGWRVTGSLLRLDTALAHLSLRRMDATVMPASSVLSTNDRRTLAITVSQIDPLVLLDSDRDAVAAAIAKGRGRVAALATDPASLASVARDAALSEWRANGIRWVLANGGSAAGAFTMLEFFRLGATTSPKGWGAASMAVDGCLCLRMPDPIAWEEYSGRGATGQLATQLADVMLRTAEVFAAHRLPAVLMKDVAAFAMQEVLDRAEPAYFDDWLALAFAARDLTDDRFADFVSALTADGPLILAPRGSIE